MQYLYTFKPIQITIPKPPNKGNMSQVQAFWAGEYAMRARGRKTLWRRTSKEYNGIVARVCIPPGYAPPLYRAPRLIVN